MEACDDKGGGDRGEIGWDIRGERGERWGGGGDIGVGY